jgi:predicted DNA-binding helix-hairpin-helix protein
MAVAVRSAPALLDKLERLGQAARYDLSCACGPTAGRTRGAGDRWIYPAVLPSGERVPLLKVLQEGRCDRGCRYCAQGTGGVRDATAFTPEELTRVFFELRQAGRVDGLFLSSAIRAGAVRSMDRMLATAELVRRGGFRGYLHLKLIPGSGADQIERAMQLATRVSVNLEAPTALHLERVAPAKHLERHLLAAMRQVAAAEAAGRFARAGQTTQFVVGASDESDRDLGRMSDWLYRRLGLRRVYYSAFQPVPGTALADRPPTPPLREHRLYQMDFLLRRYGFALRELPFDASGALPRDRDPKTAWAERHPERFPVEVNTAPVAELLRVPGVGPRTAARLLELRAAARLRSRAALRAAGVPVRVAAPYLLLDGRRAAPRQLCLC